MAAHTESLRYRSGRPRVCYKMKKTADTVGVPLIPEAKQILGYYDEGDGEDWVFPISEGMPTAVGTKRPCTAASASAIQTQTAILVVF